MRRSAAETFSTLLANVADDVVWIGVYGTGPHVPTSGERRGKAAVAEFFAQVGKNVNFSRFEPKEFIATGDKVVALGDYSATTPGQQELRLGLRDGLHGEGRQGDALPGVLRQRGNQRRVLTLTGRTHAATAAEPLRLRPGRGHCILAD